MPEFRQQQPTESELVEQQQIPDKDNRVTGSLLVTGHHFGRIATSATRQAFQLSQ
ncbi:hypothetical protein DX885_000019 [Vibrio mimicus]|uniref:hypothetical protein n=1 Tax=Vibrio mimicus TaxID=674 RepID=UPI001651C724|nr:hypothetical protein [Vibrio mimicus]